MLAIASLTIRSPCQQMKGACNGFCQPHRSSYAPRMAVLSNCYRTALRCTSKRTTVAWASRANMVPKATYHGVPSSNLCPYNAQQLSNFYEMHIYTMGTRAYARTVARILDDTGTLFGDRILSRDDGFDQVHKWTAWALRCLQACGSGELWGLRTSPAQNDEQNVEKLQSSHLVTHNVFAAPTTIHSPRDFSGTLSCLHQYDRTREPDRLRVFLIALMIRSHGRVRILLTALATRSHTRTQTASIPPLLH